MFHPPPGVYDPPHFDFHFYTSSEAARPDMPPYEQAPDKFDNCPSADYIPPNYVPIPQGVPQMGKHWADVTSPELSGQQFTQTFNTVNTIIFQATIPCK